ncbi:hypothetical protein COCVIDRAFT_110938, partial [Bipolaris victoriae FI3]
NSMQRWRRVLVQARRGCSTPYDFFRNANAQYDESPHSQNLLRIEPYSSTVEHQLFFNRDWLPNEEHGRQDPRIRPQNGTGDRYEGARRHKDQTLTRDENTANMLAIVTHGTLHCALAQHQPSRLLPTGRHRWKGKKTRQRRGRSEAIRASRHAQTSVA